MPEARFPRYLIRIALPPLPAHKLSHGVTGLGFRSALSLISNNLIYTQVRYVGIQKLGELLILVVFARAVPNSDSWVFLSGVRTTALKM